MSDIVWKLRNGTEGQGWSCDFADEFDALDEAAAEIDRLRAALASVMACGCGPGCASRCRHVNGKDCSGCEEIEDAARALLATEVQP